MKKLQAKGKLEKRIVMRFYKLTNVLWVKLYSLMKETFSFPYGVFFIKNAHFDHKSVVNIKVMTVLILFIYVFSVHVNCFYPTLSTDLFVENIKLVTSPLILTK